MAKKLPTDKKNILIIGGAGFIGSHFCDEMVKKSNVICVDDFTSGDESNIDHLLRNPNFEFIKHNINEPLDLEVNESLEAFKIPFYGISEIYNFACPTSAKNFEHMTVATALTNSLGTKNALDLAVKYKAKFFQASSSVVYGPRNEKVKYFAEDYLGAVNFFGPRSCYDEGKRFAETLVTTYRDAFNLEVRIARIFRTYGPRLKINDGQMLPDFVDAALDNKDMVIYGDDKFLTSLTYVSDIVDGIKKLMDSPISTPVNLGSDQDVSLTSVAQKIIAMAGSKSKIIYKDRLLFMTELGLPDISLAKNELGWIPVVTLDNGLEKTIDYLRAQKGSVLSF